MIKKLCRLFVYFIIFLLYFILCWLLPSVDIGSMGKTTSDYLLDVFYMHLTVLGSYGVLYLFAYCVDKGFDNE